MIPSSTKHQDISKLQISQILFNLDELGNINLEFAWPDTEKLSRQEIKDITKNYAILISLINLGSFKQDMVKILFDCKDKTTIPTDKYFIELVLQNLIETEKISSTQNSNPVIMPTKVFNKKYE